MEAIASSTALAGPSSDVSTPATYEDDARHSHFALSTSAALKPTGSITATSTSSQSPEMTVKDLKSAGTRFHDDCHDADLPSPRLRSSRLFKGKGKDTMVVQEEEKKPLRLLDLPMDILKDIVKEVTHTNDLTSLALCHSALHQLTIPHIYSRFDIVWPDSSTHAEPRAGVDALTYGLATLVMAEEIFGEAPHQRRAKQGNRFNVAGSLKASDRTIRRRRGNHYAQFTKKFSLGNGPADWVQEYLITKEGGKMLGTLVALALARMRSLETFVWDMPTGILRDVWLALSSHGERDDGEPCKLEKVWVRWHDNSSAETASPIPPPPPPINLTAMPPPPLHATGMNGHSSQLHPAVLDRVEHPSFSSLPPLKSLSVLDIDELAYLDEMAVLIGNSLDKLRELRVGIARHAMTRDWVTVWEGDNIQQVDPDSPISGSVTIGEKRLGGVLGVLTGFVHDMRRPRITLPERRRSGRTPSRSNSNHVLPGSGQIQQDVVLSQDETTGSTGNFITDQEDVPEVLEYAHEAESSLAFPPSSPATGETITRTGPDPAITNALSAITDVDASLYTPCDLSQGILDLQDPSIEPPIALRHVLQLETLELERVPLSVPVMQQAFDWSRLTSLTLLNCPNHEQLWKTLRRTFAPTPKSPCYPYPRRTPNSTPKKGGKSSTSGDVEWNYHLNLKKVHTNTVSPALISFLKETLAPNSLEVLFLQEARNYNSSVQVDAIFRGPLRRHRGSLKKLLIDSSEKGSDGLPMNSSKWRRWMLTREVLSFVCSGKMSSLRELGIAMDYRDWHFFLQHLPSIPQLRSLYLPFLADHVHGVNADARELALQLVDIVVLRPEVELCYMGIANKCFEILENRKDLDGRSESALGVHPTLQPDEEEDEEEDEMDDEEEEDEEEDEETESDEDDADDLTDDEGGEEERVVGRLRLREILFYDDKVGIFKARHGRL